MPLAGGLGRLLRPWRALSLVPLMVAGVDDPKSFYYAYRDKTPGERLDFAAYVWAKINLPNLRDHIVAEDRKSTRLNSSH